MTDKVVMTRSYPWTGEVGGRRIAIRPMTRDDRAATLAFTAKLSHRDALFLQSDITKPEVIDEWIDNIERGRAVVLLALDSQNNVVGYASLYRNEASWMRHQGEIRLFVCETLRGTGIGKRLASEAAHIAEAQELDMIQVNVPRELPHVRAMLEKMGFTTEALLTDWLMDTDGNTHDLVIMAQRLKDY